MLKISYTNGFFKTRAYQVSVFSISIFFSLFLFCFYRLYDFFFMCISILSEIKKASNELNSKKKMLFSEYKLLCELMERSTSTRTENQEKLLKEFREKFEQLKIEVSFYFIKYSFTECSSQLIIHFFCLFFCSIRNCQVF